MGRPDGRKNDQLRTTVIEKDFTKYAEGSVLLSMGDTKVICTASIEEGVPRWMKGKEEGWVTAEYALLPRATHTRVNRDRQKVSGRTIEIQRLIGRSLRSVIDFIKLGERTIMIDCDVIQADGGTRTASITGAFVALKIAVNDLLKNKVLEEDPIIENVAAISVGLVENQDRLDLVYEEDSSAQVDMNIIMTESGKIVEVQGTAEGLPFTRKQLDDLTDLGEKGVKELIAFQKEAVN